MHNFLKYISPVSLLVLCLIVQPTSWFSGETPSQESTVAKEEVAVKNIPMTPIEQLQNKIAHEEKMIVLFMTSACGYCRYLLPKFNEVRAQYESQVTFQIVNIGGVKDTYKSAFKFQTVPTVIYYKNGQEVLRHGSDNKRVTVDQMVSNIKKIYTI